MSGLRHLSLGHASPRKDIPDIMEYRIDNHKNMKKYHMLIAFRFIWNCQHTWFLHIPSLVRLGPRSWDDSPTSSFRLAGTALWISCRFVDSTSIPSSCSLWLHEISGSKHPVFGLISWILLLTVLEPKLVSVLESEAVDEPAHQNSARKLDNILSDV